MIQTTQPVNFIRFHGFTLLIVAHDGIEYIEARPLCEVIGLNWRRARDTVQSGDNATLYGTCSPAGGSGAGAGCSAGATGSHGMGYDVGACCGAGAGTG